MLPEIIEGGCPRVLGVLPEDPDIMRTLPGFEETYGLVTADKIQPVDISDIDPKIYDQGSHGSCASQAGVSAFSIAWKRSYGETLHEFSRTFPYALCNGGRDAGSVISDIMEAMKNYGNCFIEQFGQSSIYKRAIPPEAFETAKRFRLAEYFVARSYDEIVSAISMGLGACCLGIIVGRNFGKLDSEGICPLPDVIMGGHAMAGCGIKWSSKYNDWVIKIKNSWGKSWGLDGYAYLRRQHFNSGNTFGSFIAIASTDDPKTEELPGVKV